MEDKEVDDIKEPTKNKSRAEYMKQYYWNNHEKVLGQQRARYKKRSEKERERYRRYYNSHRAEILARRKNKYVTTKGVQ